MHQELSVYKTLELKNNNKNKILWGHIQRSGKSFIMCGCIIEDSKNKTQCNYLVITTSPNETIMQQREVFDCNQLNDFNIILLNGKNKKPDLKPLKLASSLIGEAIKKRQKNSKAFSPKTTPVIIFESTVYPGVTEDICVPLIEEISGKKHNSKNF